ncbi:MAG TPA: GDSL-type esterase/lipase family protein, partial [Bdellovibrionales bacterium]|nr:GDSL-type esterase/lipase family protein [Bdellovibrionales bacterium]
RVMLRKAALASAAFILALGAAELLLRAISFRPFAGPERQVTLIRPRPPPLEYDLVPGASGHAWGAQVSINSLGFRGGEPRGERRPDILRVAVLGDSITFGNGLSEEQTFVNKLNEMPELKRFEFFNLAVGGYSVRNYAGRYDDLAEKIRPDLIVIAFCVNDAGLASINHGMLLLQDSMGAFYKSYLAQLLVFAAKRAGLTTVGWISNADKSFARYAAGEIEPLFDPRISRAMDELRNMGAERLSEEEPLRWYASPIHVGFLRHWFARIGPEKMPVLVAAIPPLDENKQQLWALANGIISALAAERSFQLLDLTPALSGAGLSRLRQRPIDDIHLSADGHALIANELASALSRRAPTTSASRRRE